MPVERRPPILRFGFGRELAAIPDSQTTVRPQADETRLNRALEDLPARFGDTLPFGVFVFSDGRTTEPNAASGDDPSLSRPGGSGACRPGG